MPSLITHYEFVKQSFPNQQSIFYLATQGPDPFFYYGYTTPFKKDIKDVRSYGTYLHEIDPIESFSFLIDYINKNKLANEREILINFTKGLLSHYILDRNCHPYIFYKTGFPLGKTIYSFYHSTFETAIDVLIEDKFKDYPSYKKILKHNNKELKIVSNMMYELSLHLSIPNIKKNSYYKSVKTMLTVNRIINSKFFGLRKALFNKFIPESTINAMSHPKLKNLDSSIDYLNISNKEWKDIVSNSSKGTDSFYDLLKHAKKDLLNGLKLFDEAFTHEINYEKLNLYFNQINHDGIKYNETMHYFDLIFK